MAADAMIEAPSYNDIKALVTTKFPGKVSLKEITKKNSQADNEKRRIYFKADKEIILELCTYLRDKLNFEHASSITAVDWVDHMEVVYHLSNYFNGMLLEISVDVPLDDLAVDSVANVWGGANWHEREAYELFGIVFIGHPKLERLLTPATYEYYPFRKSYKLRGQE